MQISLFIQNMQIRIYIREIKFYNRLSKKIFLSLSRIFINIY